MLFWVFFWCAFSLTKWCVKISHHDCRLSSFSWVLPTLYFGVILLGEYSPTFFDESTLADTFVYIVFILYFLKFIFSDAFCLNSILYLILINTVPHALIYVLFFYIYYAFCILKQPIVDSFISSLPVFIFYLVHLAHYT